MTARQGDTPLFSVITPVHNVESYLADFFSSLENQTFGIENLEIVLVDDGSTDASLALCSAFAQRWPAVVRVLTKPNCGQGSARNLGMASARGHWLAFPDPDDFLDPDYFGEVADFLRTHVGPHTPQLLSTSITVFDEARGHLRDDHPLQRKFRYGNRLVDLAVETDCIQMSAATAMFARSVVADHGLAFDDRVRPNFEDGHFIANYLLRVPHPHVGLVATAKYFYRRRADNSSTMDTTRGHVGRFTDVPRYGFLSTLETATELHGVVPAWLQNMILYNLAWYLKADSAVRAETGSLDPSVLEEFHELIRQVRAHLDDVAIARFDVIAITDEVRFCLAHGYADGSATSASIVIADQDIARGLVKLTYLFTGRRPVEAVFVDSAPNAPAHAKDRAIRFYQRTLAFERVLWVPLGSRTTVLLNGEVMAIGSPPASASSIMERHVPVGRALAEMNARAEPLRHPTETLRSRALKQVRELRRELSRTRIRERLVLTVLSLGLHAPVTRREYGGAWVFMDRIDFANDNAEHLYRYARDHAPDINAWFVLGRNSPDWRRLRSDGFRLVAYGSLRWRLLVLSADQVVSAHADLFVIDPPHLKKYGPRRWRFTYLRHGVMANDTSRWLTGKRIDLLITTSPLEHAAVVADGSPYSFSSKEARLTGMSRHDTLVEKRLAAPPSERSLVLFMPTWRSQLRPRPKESAEQARERFAASTYASAYRALVGSPTVERLAKSGAIQFVFMPHPNVASNLELFDVPDHVQVRRYDETDVQQVLARAAAVVTDYSSLGFEAAKIEVPVAYFQPDAAEMFSGLHSYRRGHFDYEVNGFGPVLTELAQVEDWLAGIQPNQVPTAEYLERMRAGFAFHDTGSRARIIAAMRELNTPYVARSEG